MFLSEEDNGYSGYASALTHVLAEGAAPSWTLARILQYADAHLDLAEPVRSLIPLRLIIPVFLFFLSV